MITGFMRESVTCGGDVEAGSLVDEQWPLDPERHHFTQPLATDKTQAPIEHMLKNGKPLRNYRLTKTLNPSHH